MNAYEFEKLMAQKVKTGKLEEAIKLTEEKLSSRKTSGFHKIIGRDLLHLKESINEFLVDFYKSALVNAEEVKALSCEMNGFTINYDLWFVTGVSLGFCNNLDDTDWLADFNYYYEMGLVVEGFEDLQKEYEDYMVNEKWDDNELEEINDYCALLITLRLQQAFEYAHNEYKGKSEWTSIPLFITSHESEVILPLYP